MLSHSLKRIVDPVTEPVTLAEAKRHCNVVTEDEDSLLWSLIQAAREQVETDSNRSLITQTWRLRLHDFFADRVELPRPPLVSVTSITYVDLAGATQTAVSTLYDVDTDREPGVIWRDEDAVWPAIKAAANNAVTISYVAGYGDACEVPQRAKQAILLLVGHWYRVREAVGTVGTEVALAYQSLIRGLKPGGYP